jgi:hypothetical protein
LAGWRTQPGPARLHRDDEAVLDKCGAGHPTPSAIRRHIPARAVVATSSASSPAFGPAARADQGRSRSRPIAHLRTRPRRWEPAHVARGPACWVTDRPHTHRHLPARFPASGGSVDLHKSLRRGRGLCQATPGRPQLTVAVPNLHGGQRWPAGATTCRQRVRDETGGPAGSPIRSSTVGVSGRRSRRVAHRHSPTVYPRRGASVASAITNDSPSLPCGTNSIVILLPEPVAPSAFRARGPAPRTFASPVPADGFLISPVNSASLSHGERHHLAATTSPTGELGRDELLTDQPDRIGQLPTGPSSPTESPLTPQCANPPTAKPSCPVLRRGAQQVTDPSA